MKVKILIIILSSFICFAFTQQENLINQLEVEKAECKILKKTISMIETLYLWPEKINYSEMFKSSLNALENRFSEVLVTFKEENLVNYALLSINSKELSFLIEPSPDSKWIIARASEIISFIKANIKEKLKDEEEIEYTFINGALSSLDKYSRLLVGEGKESFEIRINGELGGIGAKIGIKDDNISIMEVIEGTPAQASGLKEGDIISYIDGESTINMGVVEAVSRIRGKPGTKVTLTVTRKGKFEDKEFTIKRDIIKIDNVISYRLSNDVGYIKITNFSKNTLENFESDLEKISPKESPIKGLILDLRYNQGGSLKQAAEIVDKFVENGLIVKTEGKNNSTGLIESIEANPSNTLKDLPVIVLVNEDTASGSEILAGALKYMKRAVIIGTPTFGKGTIQRLYSLTDLATLKLTVARYVLPYNHYINYDGLMPDILLKRYTFTKDKVYFKSELEEKEDKKREHPEIKDFEFLERPFIEIAYFYESKDDLKDENSEESEVIKSKEEKEEMIKKLNEDFYVTLAKELILNFPYSSQEEILKKGEATLLEIKKKEEEKIIEMFSKIGIDWSFKDKEGTTISNVKCDSTIEKSNLKAGEKADLSLTITCHSKEPLYQFYGLITADNSIFSGEKFIFGTVNPEIPITKKLNIEIPTHYIKGEEEWKITLYDKTNHKIDEFFERVLIEGNEKPKFAFQYGNFLINKGEKINSNLSVINISNQTSGEVKVKFHNPLDTNIELIKGTCLIPSLEAGKTYNCDFVFFIKEGYQKEFIELEFSLYDSKYKYYTKKKFNFKLGEEVNKDYLIPPIMNISHILSQNNITLKGNILDDKGLDKVYILLDEDKVLLESFDNLPNDIFKIINVNFPLKSGKNLIQVIAEDKEGLISLERFIILSKTLLQEQR